MTSMIERVADAIEDQMASEDNHPHNLARAAIHAMRDATPEMIKQAHGYTNLSSHLDKFWQAMIDAALNETE